MKTTFAIAASLLLAQSLSASAAFERLLTTDPAAEYEPAVSPDGRSLVYTAEQDRIQGLRFLDLRPGKGDGPQAFHAHPAPTHSPVFSPDGRHLAYVSQREDALGDVFLVRFPNGTPVNIGTRGVIEEAPQFSADGRLLFFRSRTITGEPIIRAYSPRTKGFVTDWDRALYASPAAPFPIADHDAIGNAALLYSDDTNGDGELGPGDDATAWELRDGEWHQVSIPLREAREIARNPRTNEVFVSARWLESFDIGVLAGSPLRDVRDPSKFIELAKVEHERVGFGSEEAIAYLRAAYRTATDPALKGDAAVGLARALNRIERFRDAEQFVNGTLEEDLPQRNVLQLRAQRLSARFQIGQQTLRENPFDTSPDENVEGQLAELIREFVSMGADEDVADARLTLSRMHFARNNFVAAAEDSESLVGDYHNRISADLLCRIMIFRADLFTAMGLGPETERALIAIFEIDPPDTTIKQQAADRLIEIARYRSGDPEREIIELRMLATQSRDFPFLLASIRLEEGLGLVRLGAPDEAMDAFREASRLVLEAPEPAARALEEMATIYGEQGNHTAAITSYHRAESALRADPNLAQTPLTASVRSRLVDQYLAKGRREMRLNDPLLALSTFNALLRFDPTLVEGVRGRLRALATNPEFLETEVEKYRRAARSRGSDSLTWYAYGLALSYMEPASPKALEAVQRAIQLDPTVPHYYLTQGFILEQQYAEREERGRTVYAILETAAASYAQALSMANETENPNLHADILLNSANTALALKQNLRAATLYRQREEMNIPFDDVRTELLFHWNGGIAAYRAGDPVRADAEFLNALETLERILPLKLVDPEVAPGIRLEIMERRALALMELERLDEAELLFQQVAAASPENSLARVRALRNRAILMQQIGAAATGQERASRLRSADQLAREALDVLTGTDIKPGRNLGGASGIVNMSLLLTSDAVGGGARLDFDKQDEERLIRATLGRVAQLRGERAEAISEMNRQIDLDPTITDDNRSYYYSIRTVTYSRMAEEAMQAGRAQDAVQLAREGLRLCRFEIVGEPIINTNGSTQLLAQLAEALLVDPSSTVLPTPDVFWMINPQELAGIRVHWALLDRAATSLAEMPDPLYPGAGIPLIVAPADTARLQLVRVIAQEQLAMGASAGVSASEGVSLIRESATAARHQALLRQAAERLRDLANAPDATEEVFRLSLLASAAEIRVLARNGDEEATAALLQRTREFAERTGHGANAWWFTAQAALHSASSDIRTPLIADVYTDLSSRVAFSSTPQDGIPTAVLEALEAHELQQALDAEDPEAAWDVVDRWRVVRLRWLAELGPPQPVGPEEREWLARLDRLRGEVRGGEAALRRLPLSSENSRGQTLARAATLREEIAEHIEDGRQFGFPAVDYVFPEHLPFESLAILLEPPFLFEHAPRFHLHRNIGSVNVSAVYTPEESSFGEPSAGEGDFVPIHFGDVAAASGTPIQVLTSESFYRKFEMLSLRAAGERYEFPRTDDADWQRDLQLAYALQLTQPARAAGLDPGSWLLEQAPHSLREVFSYATNLELASVPLSRPAGYRVSEERNQVLALAGWLNHQGVAQAEIDGARWLGIPLDPTRMPELAREEMAAAQGVLELAVEQNENERGVRSLEKVIVLKEALGETEGLALDYNNLAILRDRVGRRLDALEAAERSATLLREEDPAPADLAQAVLLIGNIASRARAWDRSWSAYEEAAELFASIDDTPSYIDALQRHSIVLEAAGEYPSAVEMVQRILSEATEPQDRLQAEYRLARLYRIYLNRYAEAEAALVRAAEIAAAENDEEWRAAILIDHSRVLQQVANFDRAESLLAEAEQIAPSPEIELERANIHWLRSEYFESFRAQQNVLDEAERSGRRDILIALHNVSGLTSWAVNDVDRAFRELYRALEIAEDLDLDSEVASTANNIGLVFRTQQRFDEANNWFAQALAIDRRQGNRWGEAYALRNTAITSIQAGAPADAIDPLNRAIELTTDIGDELNLTKALVARGDAHQALGNQTEARRDYQEAFQKAVVIPVPEMQWRALYGMGRVALAEQRTDDALQLFGDAIEVVDAMRASIRIEEFQDGFLIDKQELYSAMIELQLARGEVSQALESSERSRGRNFIDLLGNRRINFANIESQEIIERERTLRLGIEAAERAVNAVPESERAAAETNLARLRQDYSDMLIALRAEDPALADFVRVEPLTTAELQAMLEEDTRLLVYHVLPEQVILWVVGPQSLDLLRLEITEEQLTTRIGAARVAMQNFLEVDRDLRFLGRALIQPVLPLLDGVSRVGVVPHRQMHTLPFACLPVSEEEDLIDRVAIFYTPSAGVLRYTTGRRSRREGEQHVLGFGNPSRGAEFDLPFAEKEAERLAFSFPEEDVTIRTGDEATESWLVENLQDYAIIHIAGHGEFDPDLPLFSAVLLAPDQENDGTLSAQEVLGLQTRADLIALSACQTGLGRVSAGDDIVGLNRAFVYAGTRQLLTTLWRVDDISTAVLFKYFYRNANQTDRAEALRQAQIELRDRPTYRHPAHWAGLVISGDWE